jgi:hypothetical protein
VLIHLFSVKYSSSILIDEEHFGKTLAFEVRPFDSIYIGGCMCAPESAGWLFQSR